MVLVDGDGAIFLDEVLEKPEDGAKEAAERLKQAVRVSLDNDQGDNEITALVNVYANIKSLAKTLYMSDIIVSMNDLTQFAENFTDSNPEFNFINVGSDRKNKMGSKFYSSSCLAGSCPNLLEMLHYFYHQCQCKKIFVVGCHKERYIHDLQALSHYPDSAEKIVLVETTPASPSFRSLPFDIIHFENVFRSEPLKVEGQQYTSTGHSSSLPTPNRTPHSEDFTNLWIRASHRNSPNMPQTTPTEDTHHATESPSTNTPSNNAGLAITHPRTYTEPTDYKPHRTITKAPRNPLPRSIDYNKNNNRLDPPNPKPTDAKAWECYTLKLRSVQDTNRKGFCNFHYLTGHCKRGLNCQMEHEMALSAQEMIIQRYRARFAMCLSGSKCREFACFCSHHCPWDLWCMRVDCWFLHLGAEERVPW